MALVIAQTRTIASEQKRDMDTRGKKAELAERLFPSLQKEAGERVWRSGFGEAGLATESDSFA